MVFTPWNPVATTLRPSGGVAAIPHGLDVDGPAPQGGRPRGA